MSVSPGNNRLACIGYDAARLYVMSYVPGAMIGARAVLGEFGLALAVRDRLDVVRDVRGLVEREEPIERRGIGGVPAQETMLAENPQVARARDRIFGRIRRRCASLP